MKYLQGVFVFFVGLLVHWMWTTHFSVFGLAPQVLLLLTIVVAARSGPVAGQCFGFSWGLFMDLLSAHLFGANALSLTLIAYFVGMLRRQVDVSSPPSQVVLVAILTPVYFILYGVLGLVFEQHFLWPGWKAFLVDPFYNCLVAPFAFAFTRRFVDL